MHDFFSHNLPSIIGSVTKVTKDKTLNQFLATDIL